MMLYDVSGVRELGEMAFPTVHMRTEGGLPELTAADRHTCHQMGLLL